MQLSTASNWTLIRWNSAASETLEFLQDPLQDFCRSPRGFLEDFGDGAAGMDLMRFVDSDYCQPLKLTVFP